MTQARFDLDDFSVRVIDVFKGKFGLKSRNDAINRFIHLYGDDYLELSNEEVRNIRKTIDDYEKDNKKRTMTLKELDLFLLGTQKAKMAELWDNEEDKDWEKT